MLVPWLALLQLPDLLISDIQMVLFYLWCEGMDTKTEECVLKEKGQIKTTL